MSNVEKFSKKKILLFSFLPLFFLLFVVEILLRCFYFQINSPSSFAIAGALRVVSANFADYSTRRKAKEIFDSKRKYKGLWEALYGENGRELLDEFKVKYEEYYKTLVEESEKVGTKLIVLYLPSTNASSSKFISQEVCRKFFSEISEKYKVSYLDLNDKLREYSWDEVTLQPENSHLSRFGNRIVAKRLNDYLKHFKGLKSKMEFSKNDILYGDLAPSKSEIWNESPDMPYKVITNKAGFRNINELAVPKEKQRVLILGDSFTFGPYLPNHDTYPALLGKYNTDLEVINGGVSGYTVSFRQACLSCQNNSW